MIFFLLFNQTNLKIQYNLKKTQNSFKISEIICNVVNELSDLTIIGILSNGTEEHREIRSEIHSCLDFDLPRVDLNFFDAILNFLFPESSIFIIFDDGIDSVRKIWFFVVFFVVF